MDKIIMIHHSKKKVLMSELGTSRESVQRALRFDTDSYLARRIRERALELGGKLMKEVAATAEVAPTDQGEEEGQ